MGKKKSKGSISDGEQRDIGQPQRRANDLVKTDHGRRKHVNGQQTAANSPNLE